MLSRTARARALEAAVPDGGYSLGLASARVGGALTELRDAGYTRQPIALGPVQHLSDRSERASVVPVRFGPFAEDAPVDIREWFIVRDTGEIVATGPVDPVGYLAGERMLSVKEYEALGTKDAVPVYQRPVAGWEITFPAGGIALFINDMEAA